MAGNRFALLIATDRYEDPGLRQLIAPARDAEALGRVLGDPEIGGFAVQTAVNQPSQEVARRIEEFFADRRREDLLLLYFSGHGLKDDSGRLFLAMRNTERRWLSSTAVSASFVQEIIGNSRGRQKLLLLDCCYSGAFARAAATKADAAVHTQESFSAAGSVVLTASDALQYSFEGDQLSGEGVESVFTRILVDGLRSGDADRDADGDISLDELYDYLHDRVTMERPQQRPGKWEWDIRGRLMVARNPHWTLPTRMQEALDSPFSGMRHGAIDELTHLLQTGNERVFIRAREALQRLVEDDSRQVSQAAAAALAASRGGVADDRAQRSALPDKKAGPDRSTVLYQAEKHTIEKVKGLPKTLHRLPVKPLLVVGAVLTILLAVLLAVGSRDRTPSPGPVLSQSLRARVPASFRSTCTDVKPQYPGIVAGLSCTPTRNAARIWFYQFTDGSTMSSSYQEHVRRVATSGDLGNDCETDLTADVSYHTATSSGSALCVTAGEGGKARLLWTSDQLLILSEAEGGGNTDTDRRNLYMAMRRQEFGPQP